MSSPPRLTWWETWGLRQELTMDGKIWGWKVKKKQYYRVWKYFRQTVYYWQRSQSNFRGETWQIPLCPGDLRWHHGRNWHHVSPDMTRCKGHTALTQCSCQKTQNPALLSSNPNRGILWNNWSALFKNTNVMKATGRPKLFQVNRHKAQSGLGLVEIATRNIFRIPRWC